MTKIKAVAALAGVAAAAVIGTTQTADAMPKHMHVTGYRVDIIACPHTQATTEFNEFARLAPASRYEVAAIRAQLDTHLIRQVRLVYATRATPTSPVIAWLISYSNAKCGGR